MTSTRQHQISGIFARSAGIALALVAALWLAVVVPSAQAQAYKETVLHTFTGADGFYPQAGVIRDAAGNLYGTTRFGGAYNAGVVFKVDATGKETVLYTFTGHADGGAPESGLIHDAAGNLYGTTRDGGKPFCGHPSSGCGVVFKIDTAGNETVLHAFSSTDLGGYGPIGGLVADAAGNLYGTTSGGGDLNCNPHRSPGCGAVFKLDSAGAETVLYTFHYQHGAFPYAGVIRDGKGNLYGTANGGGGASNAGVVFKLHTNGVLTVLHSFTRRADGAFPYAALIHDAADNLYGTTYGGGANGSGVAFKLDTTGNETVLYAFSTGHGDGDSPYAGLIRDAAGNLYGTTFNGGGSSNGGVVFKLDTAGNETVLYKFKGETDGANPYGGLVQDAAGNLYGATANGGDPGCNSGNGCGTVFELTP